MKLLTWQAIEILLPSCCVGVLPQVAVALQKVVAPLLRTAGDAGNFLDLQNSRLTNHSSALNHWYIPIRRNVLTSQDA